MTESTSLAQAIRVEGFENTYNTEYGPVTLCVKIMVDQSCPDALWDLSNRKLENLRAISNDLFS